MSVAAIVPEYIRMSEHPDLQVYRRDFGEKIDFKIWEHNLRKRCNLAGFYNKHILEAGCGFGWDAVAISEIGNNDVLAVDILPSMIDSVNECLNGMEKAGKQLKVKALQGDICTLDLPSASFDGIYSSEAIEHVRDLAAMFRRCLTLLKPGGRLLIVNDSNQFNSEFRDATFEMWKRRDASWEHADWLKKEVRPVEHENARPYAAMREDIVRKIAPDMPDARVEEIVTATAGLIRPEIEAAVHRFTKTGERPAPPKYSWCRNPETGEYAERLLNPFELRDMLKAIGFNSVRVRHGFNRFPHRLLNGIQFKPLNKLLFDRRGLFIILAHKP